MVDRVPGGRLWLLASIGALALCAGLVVIAEESDASHYFSGHINWRSLDTPTGDQLFQIGGFISGDARRMLPATNDEDPTLQTATNTFCSTPTQVPYRFTPATVDWGAITAGGTAVPYDLEVVAYDLDHCRFSARIVHPGTSESVTIASPHGLNSQIPFSVEWRGNARVGTDQYHQNNPAIPYAMRTLVVPMGTNSAPVIDFGAAFLPGVRSEIGHGNMHCPPKFTCEFYVDAADVNGDKLSYRLATSAEAGSASFRHPGPGQIQGRKTGDFTVNKDTGLVTWDTNGGRPGDIYSTQIHVSDGKTSVPIDFMLEITPYELVCPDGQTPRIDPETGLAYCPEEEEEEDCEIPGTDYKDWDGDGDCEYPPKPEVEHPRHEPVPNPEFYLPGITTPLYKAPAVSDGHGHVHLPQDRVNAEIAGLDQDDDGLVDRLDPCPYVGDGSLADFDGDSVGDGCDEDLDGDGFLNEVDPCEYDSFNLCLKTKLPTVRTTAMSSQNGLGLASEDGVRRGDAAVQVASLKQDSQGLGASWMIFVILGLMGAILLVMALRRRGQ